MRSRFCLCVIGVILSLAVACGGSSSAKDKRIHDLEATIAAQQHQAIATALADPSVPVAGVGTAVSPATTATATSSPVATPTQAHMVVQLTSDNSFQATVNTPNGRANI